MLPLVLETLIKTGLLVGGLMTAAAYLVLLFFGGPGGAGRGSASTS